MVWALAPSQTRNLGAHSCRGDIWINVRDPLYFLGYGIPHIYVKKDPFFFLG